MRVPRSADRVGIVVLLSLGAILLHECGQLILYQLSGVPVRITLQSVRPVGSVGPMVDLLGKLAGPVASWGAAVGLLFGVERSGFAWRTAAFTNASLRLFPTAMDLWRAGKGAPAFSDEGEIALALSGTPAGRGAVVSCALLISGVLTVVAAKRYGFRSHVLLKSIGTYGLSLACGIVVVIVDELISR